MLIILMFTTTYGRPYATSLPPTLRPGSEIDKVFEKWYYRLKTLTPSVISGNYFTSLI